MSIKPIETRYKNFRFRSRLEARWAVFFDALGIHWEYEPEGFSINGEGYLPDFFLPNQKTIVEIKPNMGDHAFSNIPQLSFYLAGKITKDDWRRTLLREGNIFGYFGFTGPTNDDLTTNCLHGVEEEFDHDHGYSINRPVIYEACINGIEKCDILFAWLNTPYVHATLAEIGLAKGMGKEVWIAQSKSFNTIHGDDYWFISMMADNTEISDDPRTAFLNIIKEKYIYPTHYKYMALSYREGVDRVYVFYGSPGYENQYCYGFGEIEGDPYNTECNLAQGPVRFKDGKVFMGFSDWNMQLEKALLKAKAARFEHGEKG